MTKFNLSSKRRNIPPGLGKYYYLEKDIEKLIELLKRVDNCVEVKNKKGDIYFAVPLNVINNFIGKKLSKLRENN